MKIWVGFWLAPIWLALIAAPFIGSFLGVLIRRLPEGGSVIRPRSACEGCGRTLAPWEMVPVLSFAVLRGRCRYCAAPIARTHLAVELAALLVPLTAYAAGITSAEPLWASCALGWTLLALGWIDAISFRLPDSLTLPLVVAGIAQCWGRTPEYLVGHALAAMIGWGALRAVALTYHALRHREGLGQGDAKLYAAGGAWVGIAALPSVLLLAALLGLALAGCIALRQGRLGMTARLPFGPPLAAAIWAVWLLTR